MSELEAYRGWYAERSFNAADQLVDDFDQLRNELATWPETLPVYSGR